MTAHALQTVRRSLSPQALRVIGVTALAWDVRPINPAPVLAHSW
ncbi:hypothetical protein PGB34_06030 [Xenophilus arseniciresistens]|uniref:Uncharacterized protein n=1 Tax=Xenophilus arseniciresistens TaxID=1283306 RepID=A0AAE3N7C8_9BURK|nr:hypothetical protein [Xenophilus arseniciresistens]MDA7415918.1 hypothetical protein [Xenophilus arseniciresistens]